MIKKVLVTGSNGFVGRRLCISLQKKGYFVVGGVRRFDHLHPLLGSGTETKLATIDFMPIGKIDDETDWSAALEGVDAVVHLAARVHILQEVSKNPLGAFRSVNVLGSKRLAESAAQAGVKRFVYVSSISIHGNSTGDRPYVEEDKAHPHSPYAASKWEGELALKSVAEKSGLELVVVRPPLVYGPGVGGNFLRLMRWADKGWPLPLGCVQNLRSFIYIDNLVDMLVSCVEHQKASGETFLVADGEDLSTPDLICRIACLLNRTVRILPFPVGVLRSMAKMVQMGDVVDRLCNSLQVNAEKAHRLLGWHPRTSLNDGLAKTAAWYAERKKKDFVLYETCR